MADEKSNGKSKLLSDQIRNELEKLTESISGMMENMKKMETPIFESRRRLPKANEQLDKITAQTEAATHQMLDMVEQILEYQEKIVQFSGEVLEFMKKSPSEGVDTMLEKINSIHEMATTSQNSSFLIMDALQFQDITAQQMNHASHLLEDIEGRLQHLLLVFDGNDINELAADKRRKDRAYDPDADLFEGKPQEEVDDIISKVSQK
jgi:chemotaxis protein CheZ